MLEKQTKHVNNGFYMPDTRECKRGAGVKVAYHCASWFPRGNSQTATYLKEHSNLLDLWGCKRSLAWSGQPGWTPTCTESRMERLAPGVRRGKAPQESPATPETHSGFKAVSTSASWRHNVLIHWHQVYSEGYLNPKRKSKPWEIKLFVDWSLRIFKGL